MDPKHIVEIQAYKAETDPKKKRKLLGLVVKHHEGLVKKFVERYLKHSTVQAEFEDVFQAGTIGLMKAIEIFDPKKGALSTIAAHYIRHEVQDTLIRSTGVYRPRNAGIPWQIKKEQDRFLTETGHEATAEELTASKVLLRKGQPVKISPKNVEDWRSEFLSFTRINQNTGKTGSNAGCIELEAHENSRPDLRYEKVEYRTKILRKAVGQLEGRHRMIIDAILADKDMTEMQEELKMTKEELYRFGQAALDNLKELMEELGG